MRECSCDRSTTASQTVQPIGDVIVKPAALSRLHELGIIGACIV